MSSSPKNKSENEEIDLSIISKGIGNFFQQINNIIFNAIQFVIKNIIIIGILFVLGIGMGIYLDKTRKTYDHEIIVQPNFGSTDYVYSKIDLLQSKIKDNDTMFLKSVGIKNAEALSKIEIKPIIDVYRFITANEQNFELLKLMSEDSDVKKIVEDKTTSKNYQFHLISLKTQELTTTKEIIEPLMAYLNDTAYFTKLQKQYVDNVQTKIKANDVIIAQIDAVLNTFANNVNGDSKSDKLVYYNENTQLNDVIKTKNNVVTEQGVLKIELVGLDKVVKEVSKTINIENTESINGKLKLLLPFLFICGYILIVCFISFYKKQAKIKHES